MKPGSLTECKINLLFDLIKKEMNIYKTLTSSKHITRSDSRRVTKKDELKVYTHDCNSVL